MLAQEGTGAKGGARKGRKKRSRPWENSRWSADDFETVQNDLPIRRCRAEAADQHHSDQKIDQKSECPGTWFFIEFRFVFFFRKFLIFGQNQKVFALIAGLIAIG